MTKQYIIAEAQRDTLLAVAKHGGMVRITNTLQSLPELTRETVAWESDGDTGLTRYITDTKYKKFTPAIQRFYKPFECSSCHTHAQPLQPITTETLDDEMIKSLWLSGLLMHTGTEGKAFVVKIINAWIKHRGDK